jgi:MFS family permease
VAVGEPGSPSDPADRSDLSAGWHQARPLLTARGFRRLLAVRLVGQTGDGVFQVALASYVLFSPERAASPTRVAAAFAVLLLPYTLLGPFAGVLLDRWRRRQVLLVANLIRSALAMATAVAAVTAGEGAVLALALVTISVNRLILTALGASLPKVVDGPLLVPANAIAPTMGTLAAVIGGGLGVVVRALAGGADRADEADAAVLTFAALLFAAAALLALRLAADALGPTPDEQHPITAAALRGILHDLVAGLRAIEQRVPVRRALEVMGVHRLAFGVISVLAIVNQRAVLHPGDSDAALAGLAAMVLALGAGALLGALAAPPAVRRVGERRWTAGLLVAGVFSCAILGPLLTSASLVALSFAIGLVGQGIKVVVDTVVQREMVDVERGRAFAAYDVLFNAAFLLSVALVAAVLPADGRSPWAYLIAAALYGVGVLVTSRSAA